MIETIKYIIFGLVQGLTEPLPISSSGHLVVLRYLFNTNTFDDLTFEIVLNFASFLAIFFLFRKDIFRLVSSFFKYIFKKESRLEPPIKADYKYCWKHPSRLRRNFLKRHHRKLARQCQNTRICFSHHGPVVVFSKKIRRFEKRQRFDCSRCPSNRFVSTIRFSPRYQ